jgi:hypothetical protein
VSGFECWPNLHPYDNQKLHFRLKQCVFPGYTTQPKGFKCLDVAEGRIYISHDVVFDEGVYPFAKLHSKAGARLRGEISLLPSHLISPVSINHNGVCVTNDGPGLIDFSNHNGEHTDHDISHPEDHEKNSEDSTTNSEGSGNIHHFM